MAHRPLLAGLLALTLLRPDSSAADFVQYAYDALGRLAAVADGQGRVALYRYDVVGNLVAIERHDPGGLPAAVAITAVVPGAARRGAVVSIFGKGFGASPRDNDVDFEGGRATVLAATSTRLLVAVPESALTGPVRVRTGGGGASSPEPFRVLGHLTITPARAVVVPGHSLSFVVTDDAGPAPSVAWSVGGRVGGDPTVGTIDAHGGYVAPAVEVGATVVSATSLDDPSLSAQAVVSVTVPVVMSLAAAPVGVAGAASAARAEARSVLSVGRPASPGWLAAAPITALSAPIVADVSPREAPRGTTVRVVVSGAGLQGTQRLEVLLGDRTDDHLAVTTLAASPDGSSITADVIVAAGAVAGPRVVRVVTASGSSPRTAFANNVLTIR